MFHAQQGGITVPSVCLQGEVGMKLRRRYESRDPRRNCGIRECTVSADVMYMALGKVEQVLRASPRDAPLGETFPKRLPAQPVDATPI